MDMNQMDNFQQNTRELRKRRKTAHAGSMRGTPITDHSNAENVELPHDPLLSRSVFGKPLRNGLGKTYPSLTEDSATPNNLVDDITGWQEGEQTEYDKVVDDQRQRFHARDMSPQSDNELPLSTKQTSVGKSLRPNKVVQDRDESLLPSPSSSSDNVKFPTGSKCTNQCYINPKHCKHQNLAPSLITPKAIIYDLKLYTRRCRTRQANPDNRQIFGPENGPPASYSDFRVLRPEETDINTEDVPQGVLRVPWLVENLPVIFPEWDVRFGRFSKWRLSARTVVWEMNQKWKVDVPVYQANTALRMLREGLEEDEDGGSVVDDDGGGGGSEPETIARMPKEPGGEEEDKEAAARLMASFTAPLARKQRKRRRKTPRASTSLWHVEGVTWNGDDHYREAEELDPEKHASIPGEEEDDEDSTDNAIANDATADYDTTMTTINDNDNDNDDEELEDQFFEPPPETETETDQLTSLLRTYLDLGLANTNPPPPSPPPPPRGRSRSTTKPQYPSSTSSLSLSSAKKTTTTRRQWIGLLERGIAEMRSGDFGPDEELLTWVVERAVSGEIS